MKSVLISIRPNWCEKIANGEKIIEVRKTRPKLETPFKCYIYCTKPKYPYEDYIVVFDKPDSFHAGGKVIGEFACNAIEKYHTDNFLYGMYDIDDDTAWKTQLLFGELWDYGNGATLYGWHISDLKIYDQQKELSEFYKNGTLSNDEYLDMLYDGYKTYAEYLFTQVLRRPPQSWCYVEEVNT